MEPNYFQPEMTEAEEQRSRRMGLMIGFSILATLTTGIVSLLAGWRFVPGLLGEWLGFIAGVISTPFFLEGTFVILGFIIVMSLNSWRRYREGDEFVYLDQVSGPDVPKDLPDHARWAVYRKAPLPAGGVTPLEQAEGAVAIGDFGTAAAVIAAMSHEELAAEGVLEVRLAMAEASGKTELAARLKKEITAGKRLT
jgi:hypothetical protein